MIVEGEWRIKRRKRKSFTLPQNVDLFIFLAIVTLLSMVRSFVYLDSNITKAINYNHTLNKCRIAHRKIPTFSVDQNTCRRLIVVVTSTTCFVIRQINVCFGASELWLGTASLTLLLSSKNPPTVSISVIPL